MLFIYSREFCLHNTLTFVTFFLLHSQTFLHSTFDQFSFSFFLFSSFSMCVCVCVFMFTPLFFVYVVFNHFSFGGVVVLSGCGCCSLVDLQFYSCHNIYGNCNFRNAFAHSHSLFGFFLLLFLYVMAGIKSMDLHILVSCCIFCCCCFPSPILTMFNITSILGLILGSLFLSV